VAALVVALIDVRAGRRTRAAAPAPQQDRSAADRAAEQGTFFDA
jgi:hypothetical protein